jgi:hypothetical protein
MLEAMLSEPLPALTDLALGLVALLFAVRGAGAGVGRTWRRMFWWAAIAALAGAVHHVFFTFSDAWTGPSWALISAMVVITISYALAATVEDVLGPGRGRIFWALRMASLVAYAVLAAFGYYGVSTIVACEGVTMASVLVLWVLAYRRAMPGSGPMLVALAANVVAGITRAMPSSLTELVGLDPVSLYHLAQIPPMALLYVAIIERSAMPSPASAELDVAVDDDASAR